MRKWIFLLLLFLLWGYGVIAAWSTGDYRGQVFMYYREDDAPVQEELARLVSREAGEEYGPGREQESGQTGKTDDGKERYPDITAWTLTEDVLVQNRELGRKKQAEYMSVYGSRDMAAFRRLVDGTYGLRTDREGCVISRGLAMELFGSVAVSGKQVWCRDQAYVVRGVTDDSGYIILVLAGKEERMRCLLISCGKDSSGEAEAERTLFRYGIGSGYVCVDGSFFSAVSCLAVLSAPVLVLGCLCREMLRRGIGKRRRLGLAVLAVFLLFLGIILIWKLDFKIPGSLIPGKWSDFDFWSRRAGELHDRMGRMGEAYRVEWLEQLKRRTGISAACSLGTLGCFLLWGHFAYVNREG